jgi:hypothetical protein
MGELKLRMSEQPAENRQSWLRDPSDERHKGSYDLEELKVTAEYARRIEGVDTKRKYAICFGYLGSNYQGLQINPGAATIERELEKALFLCGGVQECNFGFLHKIQFTRAARTGNNDANWTISAIPSRKTCMHAPQIVAFTLLHSAVP